MTLCAPNLLKLVGFPVICAAMFVVLGGHWAILQTVAWSQMVVSYSRDAQSVATGIQKTFSGENPCGLCKKIATAKQQDEKKPHIFKADKKVDGFLARTSRALRVPDPKQFLYPVTADSRFTSRSDPPPESVPIIA